MSVVLGQPGFFGEQPGISFFNIDSIFDFLLSIGMKPFIELGFMPEAYASGTRTCMHYKGNVTMPKDMKQWTGLITAFARHLLERYGENEVKSWFFEVWNEPNLSYFFAGSQKDYFRLYEATARALKEVSASLRVGGPATSVNAWIPDFVAFCKENRVPVDFISTHHYPSDDPLSSAGMNGIDTPGESYEEMFAALKKDPEKLKAVMESMAAGRPSRNPRDIMERMTKQAKREAGDLPLYYTEWNGSKEFDTSYQAAFIIHTLAHNHGLVEGYSYWTVSDLFEEMGLQPAPFKNAFGLLTNHGIKKPSYHVFEQLHHAGDMQVATEGGSRTCEAFALTDGASTTIFIYNHDIDRREIKTEEVRLQILGAVRSIKKAVIDDSYTNPKAVWEKIGSPLYLKQAQVREIANSGRLVFEDVLVGDDQDMELTFNAAPESVTIVKITR